MGGFFSKCTSDCKKRMDVDGDGHISIDEVALEGEKVAQYMKNLAHIIDAYAGLIGQVWNVDTTKFTALVGELVKNLDLAQNVLSQIKNFPKVPKNSVELKKMIDKDQDGNISELEVSVFLDKAKNAFQLAQDFCIKNHLDFEPVQKCYDTLNKMVETLKIINQAAAASKLAQGGAASSNDEDARPSSHATTMV